MMKARIALIAGLFLSCGAATAQVGTWQLKIQRTDGTKETGLGFITLNGDGTTTGYSITTLTFSVATLSGTWTATSRKALLVSFTETLDGQTESGTIQAKFSSKSISGKVLSDNGVTYKISGSPDTGVPDMSGNWSGTIKQSGVKVPVPESFSVAANPDFVGVFDFSGTVNGSLTATGQIIISSSGAVVGYSVGSDGSDEITGKANASKGSLSVKLIGQNGIKGNGKFTRE